LDLPIVLALRPSKIDNDGWVKAIAVRMPHDVGQSFIDCAGDRRALDGRETQSFRQGLNRWPHDREPLGIAVDSQHQQQTRSMAGLLLAAMTRLAPWKSRYSRHFLAKSQVGATRTEVLLTVMHFSTVMKSSAYQ
jgi:hypothetical protein